MTRKFNNPPYMKGNQVWTPQPIRAGVQSPHGYKAVPHQTSTNHIVTPGSRAVQAKMAGQSFSPSNDLMQQRQRIVNRSRNFPTPSQTRFGQAPIQAKMAPPQGYLGKPQGFMNSLRNRFPVQADMMSTPQFGSGRITQPKQPPYQAPAAHIPDLLSQRYTIQPKMNSSRGSVIQQSIPTPAEDARIKSFFTFDNLQHTTKAEGREPTLYFESATETGRIRQQHPSGPLIKIEPKNTKLFFHDKDEARSARRHLRHLRSQQRRRSMRKFKQRYAGKFTETPTHGQHQMEFHLSPSGRRITNYHLSGGSVRLNRSRYSKSRIERMLRHMTRSGQTTINV